MRTILSLVLFVVLVIYWDTLSPHLNHIFTVIDNIMLTINSVYQDFGLNGEEINDQLDQIPKN